MEVALRLFAFALCFWWMTIVYRRTRDFVLSTNPDRHTPTRFYAVYGIAYGVTIVSVAIVSISKAISDIDTAAVVGILLLLSSLSATLGMFAACSNYDRGKRAPRSGKSPVR